MTSLGAMRVASCVASGPSFSDTSEGRPLRARRSTQ